MDNTQLQKETAIHNEQQSTLIHISQNLLAINMNLKSIAESLDDISKRGIMIYSTSCFSSPSN